MTVVTVTYGDRWEFLRQLLAHLEADEKVTRVIVVDNGARHGVAGAVQESGLRKPRVLRNECNLGSAAGFKLGLETAQASGAEWIWLLDDDNVPEARTLEKLCEWALAIPEGERSLCAFLAHRPEHHRDVAAGGSGGTRTPARSSFCGFHIIDLPYKLWSRLPLRRPKRRHHVPSRVALPYAPYSGLFFSRGVLELIGYPRADLVLYADDTEFTYRISEAGGKIWLLPDARLLESEPSWNSRGSAGSSFEVWLTFGNDLRAYYGARNQAYFDSHRWAKTRLLYVINRSVFLFLMGLYAWRHRQRCSGRYRVIRRAIALGERGELGIAAEFPLP